MTKTIRTAAALVAGGAGAALLLGVAPAHANTGYSRPDTTGYINALIRDGVNPYPTSRSISIGYDVCTKLRSGISEENLINFLDATTSVPGRSITDMVIDAHVYLCPDAPTHGSIGA